MKTPNHRAPLGREESETEFYQNEQDLQDGDLGSFVLCILYSLSYIRRYEFWQPRPLQRMAGVRVSRLTDRRPATAAFALGLREI